MLFTRLRPARRIALPTTASAALPRQHLLPALSALGPRPLHRGLRAGNEEPASKPRSIKITYGSSKPQPQHGLEQAKAQEEQEQEQQQLPESKTSKFLSRFGALGAGLMMLGGKGKVILFSALKFGKFGSLLSIFASTAAYSMIYGLPFGVGLAGLLVVHEYGHILVLQRLGVPFKPMYLVPFFGAFVSHEGALNAYDNAKVAFGGPVVGGLASLAIAVTGQTMDSQFLIALGDFGLYLNLINLLPIGSLDGGVITGSLSRWFLVGGLGVGATAFATGAVSSPMFPLVLLMGGFSTAGRFFGARTEEEERFYDIPPREKLIIGTSYSALVLGLAIAHGLNARHKKSPAQVRREMDLEQQRQFGGALPRHEMSEFEKTVFDWSRDPDSASTTAAQLQQDDLWYQSQNNRR